MRFVLKNIRHFYIFVTITVIQARLYPEKICDPTTDDVIKCYIKEPVVSFPHSPNQIAVDRTTNSLYFSYAAGSVYLPMRYNMDNKTLVVIEGIKDAFAIASDPLTGEMYFGGSNGIYKYNRKTLKRLAIDNLDVWWLVINKNVALIKFPSLNAYIYRNRTMKAVTQLRDQSVHQFVYDMDDNLFFINGSGLYGIKHGDDEIIPLRTRPRFIGMATDNNGYVYVCSEDGIFIVSKVVKQIKRMVHVNGVLGITFDKYNHLIYTNAQEIFKLVPVK